MPPKSTVKRLPKEILEAVHQLLDSGQTLDAILEHLAGMGASVSRSALGRYSQEYQTVAGKLREAREITTAFAQQLSDLPNDMGRVTTQLLQTIVFKVLMRQAEGDATDVSSEEVMFLARSIKDMASASKTSADMEIKIRDRARKELEAEARQKLDAAVGGGQLDAQAAEEALRILGFSG